MIKSLPSIVVVTLMFSCCGSAAISQETSAQPGFKVNATTEQIRKNREQIQNDVKHSTILSPSETEKASTILKNIESSNENAKNIRIYDIQCYRKGCLSMLRFQNLNAFIEGQHELDRSVKAAWRGPLVITGPESQPDGTIQSMLVLYNKDGHAQ